MLLLLLAVAALGAPTGPAAEAPASPPVQAASPSPAPPPPGVAAAKPPAGEDKVICRKEQETGTRFPKRVCRTESSMQRMQDESRKVTQDIQTNGRLAPR